MRTIERGGVLVLRNEDLDPSRCREDYVISMMEDLHWFGFEWQEGPDVGGGCGPYSQQARRASHQVAFRRLQEEGLVYPCQCSRRDVRQALTAPHMGDEEPVYPGTCRPVGKTGFSSHAREAPGGESGGETGRNISWRFLVPDGEVITFVDGAQGTQSFVAGKDFGDFVVWRHDDAPSYQLAVVADDAAMGITEVVRGTDLLISTARQLLLYRALGLAAPAFFHCPLMLDDTGVRLAKRHDALSLRSFRLRGVSPAALRSEHGF